MTGFLRKLNELSWAHKTTRWVIPSNQGFESTDRSVPHVDQWLIVQYKFILFDCGFELQLRLQNSASVVVHRRMVDDTMGTAAPFGTIHCRIRIAQNIFR